jgi:hypothetical protein
MACSNAYAAGRADLAMDAALAAVVPLIAAAEREACAAVARAQHDKRKKEAVEAQDARNWVLLTVSQMRYAEAEEIEVAIRARGTTP